MKPSLSSKSGIQTFTNVVDPFMDFEEEPQSKIESEGLSVSLVPVGVLNIR